MSQSSEKAIKGSSVTAEPSDGASQGSSVTTVVIDHSGSSTRENLGTRNGEFPSYFRDSLESAERLLLYSAEIGLEVDDHTRNSILEARAAAGGQWDEKIAANLLAAFSQLAGRLKPVSARSLRACSSATRHAVRNYWIVAICLAVFIVPVSVATFVTSAISDSIRKDVTAANQSAVKLTSELEPSRGASTGANAGPSGADTTAPLAPGLSRVDIITELQTFASTMRAIDTRARQLNWFIFHAERDPFAALRHDRDPAKIKEKLQLPVPLPSNLAPVANDRIAVYQDVRSFGQSVVDDVSVFYGALTTCILPVLYALLGTCAYLLRSFEREMNTRTFIPSHADSPRFLIAGIVGAVVGLFNNLTVTQAASIPPLAIAFLAGYAVDVFFSFLESLIQVFTKNKGAGAQSTPASAAEHT